jgi:hypothetical protein
MVLGSTTCIFYLLLKDTASTPAATRGSFFVRRVERTHSHRWLIYSKMCHNVGAECEPAKLRPFAYRVFHASQFKTLDLDVGQRDVLYMSTKSGQFISVARR